MSQIKNYFLTLEEFDQLVLILGIDNFHQDHDHYHCLTNQKAAIFFVRVVIKDDILYRS